MQLHSIQSYKDASTKHCRSQHAQYKAQHISPPVFTAGSAGTVSWTALATVVSTPSMAVAMVVLGSLGTACSDVVVDSIVVERSRGESQVIVNHVNNGSGTNDSHSIMKTTVMINKTCTSLTTTKVSNQNLVMR